MSDQPQGPDWWVASDGKWYPPQFPTPPTPPTPPAAAGAPGSNAPGSAAPIEAPTSKGMVALLVALVVLVFMLIGGGLVFGLTRTHNSVVAGPSLGTTPPTTLRAGTSTTVPPGAPASFPRPADTEAAMAAAGLPELSTEGRLVHYHAHLDVIIDGRGVTVPKQIGIGASTISPVHTHVDGGIVHIEADAAEQFTLGQFFTEWDVPLDQRCVGAYCADATHALRAYVNGEEVDDPAAIVFNGHDEIVVWYGPTNATPDIPRSYDFNGL